MQRSGDKRSAPRIPLRVNVQCQMERNNVGCQCENLSESGILLSAAKVFPVGSIVSLRFELPPRPAGPVIQAEGIVVRAQEGDFMAVEFLRLESNQRVAVSQYIARFLDETNHAAKG